MKRCPSCQRTFPDDAPDYCPNEGMRLVKEEAAAFDPERTVMPPGRNIGEVTQPPATPSAFEQQQPFQMPAPHMQPPTPPAQEQYYESAPPPQQWQPQEGNQYQQQAGWPPAPAPQQPASPAWGGAYQQQPVDGPYGAPFTPSFSGGRSRAIAIAALVFGVDAATVMALTVIRGRDFIRILLFGLPILALALGVTSLILALQKPTKFGGVELSIIALALGVAGLVYVLMRGF